MLLAEESEGCLSLLLDWHSWAALLFFVALASTAWSFLKFILEVLPSAPPRLRYKVKRTRKTKIALPGSMNESRSGDREGH